MSGRFIVTATAGAVLALVLAACTREGGQAPGQAATPVPVTTQVVQLSVWNDTLQALGTTKARESVVITAKVSEIVDTVHFDSGQQVAAGAPLVTLRGDAQKAALASAQATFAEADRLYQRQRELAAQQLVAHSTLDAQKSIRDAAEARVRQMQADISDRQVRAPFAGVLGIRQVSPGALLTPTTPIATLDDLSRMYVDFPLPEAELATLQPGDKVTGSSIAWPGRSFEGKVGTVDARVDPGSRAVTVRADFPNPDHALRPGMLLEVRLFRPERQARVIPEIAVVQVGRDSFVYRVKDDATVERVSVKTGTRRAGMVEIVAGLEAGDRIVVDGTGKLRPGLRIEEAEAARPAAVSVPATEARAG